MQNVVDLIEEQKIIVIVRGVEEDKLLPLVSAMYDGGIRLVEVTYSANGSVSDEKTANMIKMLAQNFDGKMVIGAGTVLTEKQVALTANAGGKFIISPDTDIDVIKKTKELGLVSIPGALTPTEIQTAYKAGADFVKLFPITSLGKDYVKAIKAPLSHVKMLAVGGIDDKNMPEYLEVGICGFGVGSNIINKNMIKSNDWKGITELAKKYILATK